MCTERKTHNLPGVIHVRTYRLSLALTIVLGRGRSTEEYIYIGKGEEYGGVHLYWGGGGVIVMTSLVI